MTAPFAAPGSADDLAAAKARHPAGRLLTSHDGPPLRFADAVTLLTGPWRVSDPLGFAAAMTAASAVCGHPVADLSATVGDELLTGLAAIAPRRKLGLWWVSGVAAGHLVVEARAEAPAGRDGHEVFVLAHLVEPLGPSHGRAFPPDHSWVVVLLGDGAGGVAHVVRSTLACPCRPRCCPPPMTSARFPLAALRARLISPALEAQTASPPPPAVVPPLARRG
jgi:hypothetical protein